MWEGKLNTEFHFNQTRIEMLLIVYKHLIHNKAREQLLWIILYQNNTTHNINQHKEPWGGHLYPTIPALDEQQVN